MAWSQLPADGEVQLGSLRLPAGERITPYDAKGPVAWMTTAVVPDAGLTWLSLGDLSVETALVPVLLSPGMYHPKHGNCFGPPDESDEADRYTAAEVLGALWAENTPSEAEYARDPDYRELLAPFGRQFPGLAPAEQDGISKGTREHALRTLPEAHVGLVRARGPSDVLAAIGWTHFRAMYNPFEVSMASWYATVLRSWENRFAARLVWVGSDELRLLVDRPPQTIEAARRVAAEHFAFADECGGNGLDHVEDIAVALVGAPIWTFWWD